MASYTATHSRPKGRRRRAAWRIASAVLLLCAAPLAAAQGSSSSSTSSAPRPSSTSTSPLVVPLGQTVTAQLAVNAATGFVFEVSPTDLRVTLSLSLCSGPSIEAYDVSNTTLLRNDLGLSAQNARRSTLPRMFISLDPANKTPAPDQGSQEGWLEGGVGMVEMLPGDASDGAWVALWPPADTRSVSTGTWSVSATAASDDYAYQISPTIGLSLADTDRNAALLTSYNATPPFPELGLAILPTSGQASLPLYFNSSLCAIRAAAAAWNTTSSPGANVRTAASETSRRIAIRTIEAGQRRMQWDVTGLEASSNYTAWLYEPKSLGKAKIYPAVKFLTKAADNCRLVHDVPFCPQVAYSIPVAADISTSSALSTINETIFPNYANFSTMIDTFPCGDAYFGEYSGVKDCLDCKAAYRDWLCSVAMPRCTDVVADPQRNSAAAQDAAALRNGTRDLQLNTQLLPYVINRSNGTSRQSYIDTTLRAGTYGELLPCIYTCHFVTRSCPAPLVKWACPTWGITAQRDYGAFADSDQVGLGYGVNGAGGSWGGPTRYIATDAFGNAYCNALGVDLMLRETNGAAKGRARGAVLLAVGAATSLFLLA